MADVRGVRLAILNRQILFLTTVVISFAIGAVSESAAAQTRNEDRAQCKDSNPDLRIRACTALIQSRKESKPWLVAAFSNRGIAYASKGDYDRAILDYDNALQLEPDAAPVLNNRGNAYGRKAEFDRAIQDY